MKVVERYTKEESRILKIGMSVAVFLVLIVGLFAITRRNISHEGFGEYYPLKATFGRTDGIFVGDEVRMAGVDIGKITDAQLDENFHAIMTLEIRQDVKIPDDSSASIVSYGIMGSKYIEIEPGGSEEFLKTNAEFAYTQDALVLEELIDRIIGIGKSKRNKTETKAMDAFEQSMDE